MTTGARLGLMETAAFRVSLTVVAVLALMFSGCGSTDQGREATENDATIYGPERTSLSDPVLVRGGGVVVSVALAQPDYAAGETSRARLASVDLVRRTVAPLDAATGRGRCVDSEQLFPAPVSADEIAFVERCWDRTVDAHRSTRIVILNLATRERRTVAEDLHLSTFRLSFVAGGSWGIAQAASDQRMGVIRVAAGEAPRRIDTGDVQVNEAALAPSGDSIAVVGVQGGDYYASPSKLMLLSADGRLLRTLVENTGDAHHPGWSRDGRQIALAMDPPDGSAGIWLVDAQTGARSLVQRGHGFTTLGWASHTHIVVAVENGQGREGIQSIPIPSA
jgi:hypothetical protein